MPHGQGKVEYSNGDFYEGVFVHGKRNGYGKYITREYTYEGEWKDGVMSGNGEMTWSDG